MPLDSQQVELIGRSLLVAQLLADGLEVALPERDRGVDLIVDADIQERNRFIARPVQLKAASDQAFVVDRKYDKFPELLLAYVWNAADPPQAVTMCLSQPEAVQIATETGPSAITGCWYQTRRTPPCGATLVRGT